MASAIGWPKPSRPEQTRGTAHAAARRRGRSSRVCGGVGEEARASAIGGQKPSRPEQKRATPHAAARRRGRPILVFPSTYIEHCVQLRAATLDAASALLELRGASILLHSS